ncbi:hypothetical protein [Rathayibacter rathayi]|uniref:hypothetical protein n=1 Tax=Rathayibacter rathayi TaxID=33887 RepID=UPI0011AFFC8B|nr:hypothetical protein [Rathayibacter rathayi]
MKSPEAEKTPFLSSPLAERLREAGLSERAIGKVALNRMMKTYQAKKNKLARGAIGMKKTIASREGKVIVVTADTAVERAIARNQRAKSRATRSSVG